MDSRQKIVALLGAAGVVLTAAPAFAHHSYAMFDMQKTVTLDGTVKDFQWTNPHSWIQLVVTDPASGKEVEWSIELAAPTLISRQGWTRTSLKPGDKVVAVIHPLKRAGGENGGSMVSASMNGQPVGGLPPPKF